MLVDEAYHEFSEQSALPLLNEHRNLVVLRTFSKAMAMAGLRFGYMMAHPEIAREIYKGETAVQREHFHTGRRGGRD